MQGGPGCSSFDGSLMEIGPFRTVPASKTASGEVELELVDGGWEEFGTVIFGEPCFLNSQSDQDELIMEYNITVDQPPGTGYSVVPTNGYLHELDQASAHLVEFLGNFYSIFPELRSQDVSSGFAETVVLP